eukprot:3701196-Rhodomonas_salina.3
MPAMLAHRTSTLVARERCVGVCCQKLSPVAPLDATATRLDGWTQPPIFWRVRASRGWLASAVPPFARAPEEVGAGAQERSAADCTHELSGVVLSESFLRIGRSAGGVWEERDERVTVCREHHVVW